MKMLVTASLVGLVLAVAGCSKPTQDKAAQDLKAVGSEVGSAAKEVTQTPAAKALGSDIKQGAQEAAEKTKAVASDAGDKLKAGASDAGDKLKAGADKAGADIKSGEDKVGAKADQAAHDAKK